ncbi:MAG: hypothetical protein ACI3Y5_02760, partial [Prevotella sp.]
MEQQITENTTVMVDAQPSVQEKKPARKPRQTRKKTVAKENETQQNEHQATSVAPEGDVAPKSEPKPKKAARSTKRATQKPRKSQPAETDVENVVDNGTSANADTVATATDVIDSGTEQMTAPAITTAGNGLQAERHDSAAPASPAAGITSPSQTEAAQADDTLPHDTVGASVTGEATSNVASEKSAETAPPSGNNGGMAEKAATHPTPDDARGTDIDDTVMQPADKEGNQRQQRTANTRQQATPQQAKPILPCPTLVIHDIVELVNAPSRQLLLTDQQIQQLPADEAARRFRWIEGTLALVLDYDVVISDTNIWLELLTDHTSSHSDPRFNCRLQFERQLEFISKLTRHRGGRFMMMSETYEEIDRFASQMEPQSHSDSDFSDDDVCRNIAARLAKRLILSQQRENRLRIEGIGAESHHSAFADPAIIRRCVELFAQGRRVLLITNDASVAIRSLGMCDDLQRTNGIDDETWDTVYAPLRPMVMTMDDLKAIDAYTRQYHFLQMAAGKQWMEDVPRQMAKHTVEPLALWMEGFRAGDRHTERKQPVQQRRQNSQSQPKTKQEQKQQQPKQEQKQSQPKQE